MLLYYTPNTCALTPYILLREVGADFDVRVVDLMAGEQHSAEFARMNPKRKVPVLVVGDHAIAENVAIQVWIARNYPEHEILPADEWKYVDALSLSSWFSSGIHPYLHRIFSPGRVCELEGAAQSIAKIATKSIEQTFSAANELLDGKEFFFDRFSACDAHFFWCFRRAGQLGVDLSQFPNCQAHFERLQARPSVRDALDHDAHLKAAAERK